MTETIGDATSRCEFRLAASLTGCSIRGNMFYNHNTGAAYGGIRIGYGAAAITLTGTRIENNTSANASNNVVSKDAAATIASTSIVAGNQPDAGVPTPKTIVANYTATSADFTIISNGADTVNLPTAASAGAGREYTIKNINATVVAVRETAAANIDNTTVDRLGQYAAGVYVSDGTQWWKKGAAVRNSGTLTYTSIAAGATQTQSLSVPGALVGESVAYGITSALDSGISIDYVGVVTAGTVTVRLRNPTAGALTPTAQVWTFTVHR